MKAGVLLHHDEKAVPRNHESRCRFEDSNGVGQLPRDALCLKRLPKRISCNNELIDAELQK